jgi:hypothetical protein
MPIQTVSQAFSNENQGGFSFRNRVINGDMRIDQRNSGVSVTIPAATVTYTLDRWAAFGSAASKFSVQQDAGAVTPPAGFTDYLGVTSLSAYTVDSSEAFWVRQPIEGFNLTDLGWGTVNAKTVTLSFWVRSSLTGTFGGSLVDNFTPLSYPFSYTISAANTWEQKSITIVGPTSGSFPTNNTVGFYLQFSLGTGSTFSGTAGSWVAGNFSNVTGATSVVGTNGATFYITGVQLEVGSVATPFERRPYTTELQLCQRYFQATTILVYSSSFARNFIVYPVQMRTSPTIASGGSGFTTSISSNAGTAMEQTSAASQNLTFSAEL